MCVPKPIPEVRALPTELLTNIDSFELDFVMESSEEEEEWSDDEWDPANENVTPAVHYITDLYGNPRTPARATAPAPASVGANVPDQADGKPAEAPSNASQQENREDPKADAPDRPSEASGKPT